MSIECYVSKLEKTIEDMEGTIESMHIELGHYKNLIDCGIMPLKQDPLFNQRRFWFFRNPKNTLDFGYIIRKSVGYGYKIKKKKSTPIKLQNILLKNRNFADDYYPVISTCYNSLHYPVFDCDSFEDLEKARRFVESLRVGYFVVESSRGHHWLIFDLGNRNIMKLKNLLINVNFSDKRYIECVGKHGFLLRAFCRGNIFSDKDFPRVYESHTYKVYSENFRYFYESVKTFYERDVPKILGSFKNLGNRVSEF